MAGEVTFSLNEADFIISGREMLRHWLLKPKTIFWHLFALAVIFAAGVALTPSCGCAELSARLRGGWIFTALVAAWLVAYYVVFGLATVPWRTRRLFRQQAALRRPFTVAWSGEAIVQTSVHGTGTFRWADLRRWTNLASAVFIYYGNRQPSFILPRRALSDDQMNDLIATLEASTLPRS